MRRLAVYGTLRKGEYNHKYFISDDQESDFLGLDTLLGFDMYDLGIPIVIDGKGSIRVEVYELPNYVAHKIERMEASVGYATHEVDTKFGKAEVFVVENERSLGFSKKVKNGDWVKHMDKIRTRSEKHE